jgi:hypothetical protein
MKATAASSLTDLASRLERHVGPVSFGPVATRLQLRTGVSLRTPKPEQINDRAVLVRVSDALADMGYRL